MIFLDVPKRARLCHKGQEPFLAGHTYYSRLKLHKDREYIREDFCPLCWKTEMAFPGDTFWKGEVPPKTVLEQKMDRMERALASLKTLLEQEEGSEDDFKEAFVLALFLQRKKWLAPRGEFSRKNRAFILFEVLATEEMLEVPKMSLTPEDQVLAKGITTKLNSNSDVSH